MNFCALNYKNFYRKKVIRTAFHQLNQYFAAMKGVPWRTVSRGLYKLCNIKDKKDEELVYGQKENPIYQFTNAEFNLIVRQRAQIDLINALQVSQKIIDTGKDHAFEYVDTFDGGLQRVSLSRYISEAVSPQSMIKYFIEGFNIWTGEYIEPIRKPERPADISSFDDPADPAFDEQCDIITLETDYDKKIDDSNVQFITIDEKYRQRMDEDNQYIEKEPSVIELLTTEYNAYPVINNDERDTLLLNFRHDIDETERSAAAFFVAMNLKKMSEALKMNLTGVRQATENDYDEKIHILEVNSDDMTEKSGSVLKTLVNKYCAIPLLPYDRADEILLEFEDEVNQDKKMEALYFASKNFGVLLSELDLPAPWRGVTHVRAADADAARLAYAALYY